ncbi:MAG: hypothetical protein FWE74_03620 [Oscillospiraceae bacterium]|nr:hypothetical protein [Oscillospiraceae bacterium]
MFANTGSSPEQKEWKDKAAADGRVKPMSPGFKCACGETHGTFAKSAKMTTGEGIGAAAFRLCKDCKCYACGEETAEIKTR